MIADSSFLVGIANEDDAHHAKAMALFDATEMFVLHEHVFVETVTVVAKKGGHAAAVDFGHWLLQDDRFAWAAAVGIMQPAWGLFVEHEGLSVVDAALVALSRQRGMAIATYDKRLAHVAG